MSKTLAPIPASEPLQLAYMEAGASSGFANGTKHQKAIPYTIVAQAVEGVYEVRCNGLHEIVESGGIFVVPMHAPVEIIHRTGKRGIMSARWLHLRFSLWGTIDFLSLYKIPLQLPAPASRRLGNVVRDVLKLQKGRSDSPAAMIARNKLSLRALQIICDCAEAKENPAVTPGKRLHIILQYVQENLAAEITIHKLASLVHLSPAQFHTVFKEEFGISPMKYVRSIRLDAASRQLATRDSTLSEIAGSVGFGDPFHFSHAFKAQFGISPREYRRQLSTGIL